MHHCPSWRARSGALLIGMVNNSGRVSILSNPLQVNKDFIDAAAEQGRPESRFRFSGPCIETGCANWAGHCRFGASLLDHPPQVAEPPSCGIRDSCRWHVQHGLDACLRCPGVITEVVIETGPEPVAAPGHDHQAVESSGRQTDYRRTP